MERRKAIKKVETSMKCYKCVCFMAWKQMNQHLGYDKDRIFLFILCPNYHKERKTPCEQINDFYSKHFSSPAKT